MSFIDFIHVGVGVCIGLPVGLLLGTFIGTVVGKSLYQGDNND